MNIEEALEYPTVPLNNKIKQILPFPLLRICGGDGAHPEKHLADHRPDPAGQPDEEAVESAGGGECKCTTKAGRGTGPRRLVAHERHGGGQDCGHDNAEHDGLRSHQVSYCTLILYKMMEN